MSETSEPRRAVVIEPDLSFKRGLMEAGGETLKKCYQCGTCTITCPLAPDEDPFPRKEMLWAQWGLKDRLLADGDVWLCHQCNDCAQRCPREANPGDVMAVLRQNVIEHYSVPRFMARWVASPAMLAPLLLIPAALMLAAIWATGGLSAQPDGALHWLSRGIFAPDGGFKQPVIFDNLFGHYPIILFFTGFVALSLTGAAFGLVRYWKALEAGTGWRTGKGALGQSGAALTANVGAAPMGDVKTSILGALGDILTHRKFTECEATQRRYWGHLLLFYGFAAMFVTTTLAAILYYVATYPFPWWHPVKALGNLGGAAFLIGLAIIMGDRLGRGKLAPQTRYADGLFIAVTALTVLTGMVCQAARLAGEPVAAYAWYFAHLLLVFFLLVYLPYSKFAHLLYRTVAMIHARLRGRDVKAAAAAPGAEVRAEALDREAA